MNRFEAVREAHREAMQKLTARRLEGSKSVYCRSCNQTVVIVEETALSYIEAYNAKYHAKSDCDND